MRPAVIVPLTALLAVVSLASSTAAQQSVETLTCESRDNQHQECRYRSSGIVTVHVKRQLSSTRCVFNENWGSFDGGVWVDYGCRAEFDIRRPPQASGYSDRPIGGSQRTVTCESKQNNLRECPVPDLNPSSVHVERQLSGAPCRAPSSWGTYERAGERGIWVHMGCRAIFAYAPASASFNAYGGTRYDRDVRCESQRGTWEHCHVPDVHIASVTLRTGNEECLEYKAWGVDDTGIWVRNNCQAVFKVSYRH